MLNVLLTELQNMSTPNGLYCRQICSVLLHHYKGEWFIYMVLQNWSGKHICMALNVTWGKKGREMLFSDGKKKGGTMYGYVQALPSSWNCSDMSDNCWTVCPFHLSVVWFLCAVFCPGYSNCVCGYTYPTIEHRKCFNFQNHVFSWRQQKNVEPWQDHFFLYRAEELM